jgi:hypothetical protein
MLLFYYDTVSTSSNWNVLLNFVLRQICVQLREAKQSSEIRALKRHSRFVNVTATTGTCFDLRGSLLGSHRTCNLMLNFNLSLICAVFLTLHFFFISRSLHLALLMYLFIFRFLFSNHAFGCPRRAFEFRYVTPIEVTWNAIIISFGCCCCCFFLFSFYSKMQ